MIKNQQQEHGRVESAEHGRVPGGKAAKVAHGRNSHTSFPSNAVDGIDDGSALVSVLPQERSRYHPESTFKEEGTHVQVAIKKNQSIEIHVSFLPYSIAADSGSSHHPAPPLAALASEKYHCHQAA